MSADLLKRLAEAGTPMDLIMEVAETLAEAKAAERLLEKRREKDRNRKRNSRDSVETTEIAESAEAPLPLDAPPKGSPTPPPNNPPLNPPSQAQPRPCLLKGIGLPDWLPAEPWLAFVRMRKAIPKVPFTEDAARGVIRKVEKLRGQGFDPAKLLWKAVDHGWRTVFENDDCKITVLPVQRDAKWHEDQARFFEKIGRPDDAAEHRSRAMSIGALTSEALKHTRAA